jgi:hypothetical protein
LLALVFVVSQLLIFAQAKNAQFYYKLALEADHSEFSYIDSVLNLAQVAAIAERTTV